MASVVIKAPNRPPTWRPIRLTTRTFGPGCGLRQGEQIDELGVRHPVLIVDGQAVDFRHHGVGAADGQDRQQRELPQQGDVDVERLHAGAFRKRRHHTIRTLNGATTNSRVKSGQRKTAMPTNVAPTNRSASASRR